MLPQTKRAIDTLKLAGLERSDFSVQVSRQYYTNKNTGERFYEYGTINIMLKVRFNPELVDIQVLVDNGYNVTQYVGFVDDRTKQTFDIEQGGRCGKFQVMDFKATPDTNGFNFAKTYYTGKPQWNERF